MLPRPPTPRHGAHCPSQPISADGLRPTRPDFTEFDYYRKAVRQNREIVCALHRGLTRGLLDRDAPTATLVRFVPHHPEPAGCDIDIDGLPA
jgi:hypothetical protein